MKSRRRNASDDRLTRENAEAIPTDLIIEILSRLPAKSIDRCRCVSKPWASMLGLPYFTELFLTRSSARPQLLFLGHKQRELFFVSTPQVQNMAENSSLVPARSRIKFAFDDPVISGSVRGLVSLTHDRTGYKRLETVPVICNPSTRQYLTLPKVKTKTFNMKRSFFGYDPIDKQFKVLSMARPEGMWSYGIYEPTVPSEEHQVLTLGAEKQSWRMLECCVPHVPLKLGLCINGFLYYLAAVKKSRWVDSIVCFDVRSEKFSVIQRDEGMMLLRNSTLVNYKSKLAALLSHGLYGHRSDRVTRETESFEMWVLEDPGKHVWSKHVYKLPPMWHNIVDEDKFYFVGVTDTNEVMLCPLAWSDLFYVYYYNIESKTIRRVEIQGMDAFRNRILHVFVDHVEDVNLNFMERFKTYNLRSCNRS